MIKVSIIMPSYNVGTYIETCLKSVINQTLKDIEIIIVDKYSTDGTREIIEKYRQKDERIMLLNDDKGSCGYSNNIGIEYAAGKYIGIVETDDYIDEEMFEVLFKLAEENDLDYIKSDFIEFITNESGKEISATHKLLYDYMGGKYNECIYSNEYPELPLYDCCMWNGIYKKEYLKKNRVRFHESSGAAFQDHGFLWQAIGYAKKVMYIDRAFYHYRKDNDASSMNNSSALEMDLKELKFIYSNLEELTKRNFEYKWNFYKKTFSILENRLHQFLLSKTCITNKVIKSVEGYREILHQGNQNGNFKINELNRRKVQEFLILNDSVERYIELVSENVKAEKLLQQNLLSHLKQSSQAVLFGCGNNGRGLYWLFIKEHIDFKIMAFCDNDENKWGEFFLDKIVISPKQATERFSKAIFVIANELHCYDLRRQLLNYGIEEDKIFICRYGLG